MKKHLIITALLFTLNGAFAMRPMSEEEEIAQAMRLSLAEEQCRQQQQSDADYAMALSLQEQEEQVQANIPQRVPVNEDQLAEDFAIALSLAQRPQIAPQEDSSNDEAIARLLTEETNTLPLPAQNNIPSTTTTTTISHRNVPIAVSPQQPQSINGRFATSVQRLKQVDTNYECPVCQENFPLNDTRWTVANSKASCQHALCKPCKRGILTSGYSRAKCPMCRETLEISQDNQ